MGTSTYGDCRVPQGRRVTVAFYPKWWKGEVVAWTRQI